MFGRTTTVVAAPAERSHPATAARMATRPSPSHRRGGDESIDVLMVTHNRAGFAALALERLLATCDDRMRVWLWHNGEHAETLDLVRSHLDHPRVAGFHHSVENVGLRGLWKPMNWLFAQATGAYVGKVDDDCLVPEGWADVLRSAHRDVPELGAIGCWRFRPEDIQPDLARGRIAELGAHRILRNCWIEGTGFLLKRSIVEDFGPIPPGMSFPTLCKHLALAGWVHGWYYPFLHQEHMDDPRSPYWDAQVERGIRDKPGRRGRVILPPPPEAHVRRIRANALHVQRASLDPRRHLGWRRKVDVARGRIERVLGVSP
jgi:hypothetical protein